jgi:hypothetical protein
VTTGGTYSVELDEPTCRIVTARNVVIALWLDAPVVSQIQAIARVGRARKSKYPRGVVMVNVIVSGRPNFTQDVRDEVARLYQANLFALGACHAVLVGGLAGVATRAFLATVSLLRRSSAPSRVTGDVDSTVAWVHAQANGVEPWAAPEIRALFTDLLASTQAGASASTAHGAPRNQLP